MSRTNIPRTAHPVQSDTPFALLCPIIECGSLGILLSMLPLSSTVLLMPINRRDAVMGSIDTRLAVQVTARIADERDGPAILTATFIAAACTTLGGHGTLFVPCEERAKDAASILSRARALQGELLACLMTCLDEHPNVARARHPARYRIPDEWVWHPASLDGSGISFHMDHWTYPQPQADAAAPYEPSLDSLA